MKRYSSYKQHTAGWIESLPEHWAAVPVKYVCTYNDNVLPESIASDTLIKYVEISDVDQVNGLKGSESMAFQDAPSRARRLVRDGDIIISTVRTYLRAVAPIKSPPDNLVVSTGFAVIRPDGLAPSFARYALVADGFVGSVIARSTGVSYPAINASDLVRIPVPVPPIDEQITIAAYLDTETKRIDGLIEEKKKLLDLIEEARSSVIYTVITKGLRFDSNLSETGVSWIGTAPSHWKVMAIKRLSHVKRGASPRPIDDERYFDVNGTYGWVRIEDVSKSDGYLRDTSQILSDLGASLSVKLEPGALFLSIAGTVGKPCIADRKACIHDGFVYFPDLQINPKFLFRLFESKLPFKGLGKMGTQLNLNTQTVGDIKIALPPADEIEEIVAYLDVKLAEFDALKAHVDTELELLKELRSSTITDAVLGRIDIRGIKTH
jgi:type I restriction enzyme S subunit